MFPLLQSITEGINDRGLYKAIFVCGIPGSGKSYTVSQISDGTVPLRVVNTDKLIEFYHRKGIIDMRDKAQQRMKLPDAKQTNEAQLVQYVNGMLPLIVDSTSASEQNIVRRRGLLQSLGYDTMMVWINVDLETALARAAGRERMVNPEFIQKSHELAEENKQYFAHQFSGSFIEVNNSGTEIDNSTMQAAAKAASKFLSGPLMNPTGRRNIEQLKQQSEKYLMPTVVDQATLQNLVGMWYRG